MNFIVKNTTFVGLLDLLAPHYCRGCQHLGSPLCDRCKKYILSHNFNICPNCKAKTKNGKCSKCCTLPPIYAIGERNELLDLLIHDYKYHSVRAIGKELADLLDHVLPKTPKNTILVPLPTAAQHIRARGFDHTLYLAKKLARIRHFKIQKILLRLNNTVQVGANRQTRLAQAKQAFTINPKIKIDQTTTYILLDDVWTTGASMKAATKKLRQAGAKNIIILLLAISRLQN